MIITSKISFLLCLAIICHVVAGAAVIKSTDLKSWAEHAINASPSYNAFPASSTLWGPNLPNNNERKYSLPLHLTEPALMQVNNYGPGGSKVDIYNYHQKIGEVGSYNLTTSDNNNIGRVYFPKGNHSLSLRPYYKEDSLSTHFVKVHILPKSSTHSLKKRDPVYNNSDEYTPEYNAYVQWDYDGDSKHYHNGDDDSVYNHYHNGNNRVHKHHHHDNDNDDDCDDEDDNDYDYDDKDGEWDKSYHKDTGMDGHWWKWHSKEGWKMGRKNNKKVIYVSTVNYAGPKAPPTVTVTSTLTVDHISTIPEPPTPSAREIMVTETEIVNKAGPIETTTVIIKGDTSAIGEAAVVLPILIHTVTEYRDIRDIPIDIPGVETNKIVTITAEGDTTTISASPVTISNNPVTVTMDGKITTVFPDAVTVTNEPVTVTNEPRTVISTVNAEVTQYLFRQTLMETIHETDTVTFTDHNSVLRTVIGGTSTFTENVVVTVYNTRPRITPTPSLSLTLP